ncbi:MAG: GNAT family N-acetyltransferase [Bacteroidota bacterium]
MLKLEVFEQFSLKNSIYCIIKSIFTPMRQNYQISEQFPSPEEEEALGFPVFLLQNYVNLFNEDNSICPLLIRDSKNQILAFWVFREEINCWFSPVSAPFSCPQIYDEMSLNELLKISVTLLKDKRNLPVQFVFNPLFSGSIKFQFSRILNVELNQFIEIDKDSFMEKLPQKRRRQKLRALKRDDYVVEQIGIEQWENVYQQNLNWRKNKGHQNIIPLELMVQFKNAFLNNYLGFQLKYSNELIGCAFVVRVSEKYLYLYSLITDPVYDKQEPSLLLYDMIFDYAKANNIQILDLGTSMNLNGNIHKNIANYKKDIGALAVRKYTFEC